MDPAEGGDGGGGQSVGGGSLSIEVVVGLAPRQLVRIPLSLPVGSTLRQALDAAKVWGLADDLTPDALRQHPVQTVAAGTQIVLKPRGIRLPQPLCRFAKSPVFSVAGAARNHFVQVLPTSRLSAVQRSACWRDIAEMDPAKGQQALIMVLMTTIMVVVYHQNGICHQGVRPL